MNCGILSTHYGLYIFPYYLGLLGFRGRGSIFRADSRGAGGPKRKLSRSKFWKFYLEESDGSCRVLVGRRAHSHERSRTAQDAEEKTGRVSQS